MIYQDEIHEGLHDAIVDPEIFAQVQQQLEQNRVVQGVPNRKRTPAILKGLLYCDPCGTAMVATYAQKGKKRYRYYVCHTAQKRSWQNCPSKSIPAAEIETYVVDQIREIGQSPKLIKQTIKAVRKKQNEIAQKFAAEQSQLKQSLTTANRELTRQLQCPQGPDIDRLAELQDQIQKAEVALRTNHNEQARHQRLEISDEQIIESLSQFDRLWSSMSLNEQSRCLNLLIERVGYNGEDGTVAITLRPTGLEEFLQQTTQEEMSV